MRVRSNKVGDIISYCRKELVGIYPEKETENIIFLLFSFYGGFSRADMALRKQEYINESELIGIYSAIPELKAHRPVQYIIGETEFYDLKIKVNDNVLIPRSETEELVQMIINDNKGRGETQILDIGTGSGCIAIALAKMITNAKVSALDISEKALEIASLNALENKAEIDLFCCDIFTQPASLLYKPDKLDKLLSYVDVIVSNPPYIPQSEKETLGKNITAYEPDVALFVPDDEPLKFYERITELALKHSKKGTLIYFEIHENLKNYMEKLMRELNVPEFDFYKDINEKYRILKLMI